MGEDSLDGFINFNMSITLLTLKCSQMRLTLGLHTVLNGAKQLLTDKFLLLLCLDFKFDKIKRPKDMPFYLMYFSQDIF